MVIENVIVKRAWRGREIGARLMEVNRGDWANKKMLLYYVRFRRSAKESTSIL